MTTPEQNESQGRNEPAHLEADGYLVRALRRLGEGLGPFVAEKTGKDSFKGSRDVYAILSEMNSSWNIYFRTVGRDERDRSPRSWVIDLLNFRNGPWAHLIGYDDHDVLKYLYQICQLLKAVSADKQAKAVEQMYIELGKLIFSQSMPERMRDVENAELRQRISDLEEQNSELHNRNLQISGQLEGFQYAASLIAFAPADDAPVELTIVPTPDGGVSPDNRPIAPDSAEDYLRRGNEALREGYIEDALDYYSRAIELNPNLAKAYAGRGNAYVDGEEHELAIADYGEALRLSPDHAVTYFYRGSAYAALGDHDRAISDYSDALRLNPIDDLAMAAYGNRGNSYNRQGEYDRAIADYDAALNLNPDDEVAASLHFNRGNANADQEEYDSAIADCDIALRLNPDISDTYNVRGFAYFRKGEYDLAISDYDVALQLDPENELAYVIRGYAYLLNEDYDLVIDNFDAVLKLNPNLFIAYIIRGNAFHFNDQHDQAIADYESALALEPEEELAEQARRGMRLAQESKNRTIRSRELAKYNQYNKENPLDPQGWHLSGLYHLELEDYFLAIGDLSVAIALAPDDAAVWNDRGWARYQQGEDDQAYDDYSKAIKLEPDFANAYYNRARVWRRRGEYRNAIIDFSQAIALQPKDAKVYAHRGISYLDISDRDKAQADFEKAQLLGFWP